MAEKELYAYIGAWASDLHIDSEERELNGGIRCYIVEQQTGKLLKRGHVQKNINAGTVCISSDGRYLYSTDERKNRDGINGNGGGVFSFKINEEDGTLSYLNDEPSIGAFPCYIATTPQRDFLFVCNHGHHWDLVTKVKGNREDGYRAVPVWDDGTVAMYPLRKDGTIEKVSYVDVLEGNGPDNRGYQDSPHPHSINVDPTGKWIFVCDKGTDTINIYQIDRENKCLYPEKIQYHAASGTGPRHLAFHPNEKYLYINSELNSTVYGYAFADGKMTEICGVKTIPDDYKPVDLADHFASNFPADIQVHPNGKFLYVTNRGMETIAGYRVASDGSLENIGYFSCHGRIPRAIRIVPNGKHLYVANQQSGNIVRFEIEKETGKLIAGEEVLKIDNPVCIRFLEK